VGFEILTAMLITTAFWYVTSCSLVVVYWHTTGLCGYEIQKFRYQFYKPTRRHIP